MTIEQDALFEHQFWLQVFGDHARFIRDGLSSKESEATLEALYFIDRFDRLLGNAKSSGPIDIMDLSNQANRYARKFRNFKLELLERHLVGTISISLPPTFLNHMVNEIEEYLRILQYLCAGKTPPPQHPVHHHLLWLQDAVGHAATLAAEVDPTEKPMAHKSEYFRHQFESYYLKAVELAGFLRTQLKTFPALERFNNDTLLEMKLFREFLHEIEDMRLSKELLASIDALLPDHMAREECYYLMKLALVTDLTEPACDPTKPRVES